MAHHLYMPRVSVCIPARNGSRFICSAIDGILHQTMGDFELVVCDDGSTDGTAEMALSYGDSRIRVIGGADHVGLVRNWNRCIGAAQSEVVVVFHQDDVMEAKYLEAVTEMLDRSDRVGFVFTGARCIDALGRSAGGHWARQFDRSGVYPGCSLYELAAYTGNPVACSSVATRAECYRRWGLFDQRLEFAVDLEMWLRLAGHCHVGYVATPLVCYRVHEEQEGGRFRNSGRDFQDMVYALDVAYGTNLPPECARHARAAFRTVGRQALAVAWWQAKRMRFRWAGRCLRAAVAAEARGMKAWLRRAVRSPVEGGRSAGGIGRGHPN